jgi:thiol-disulfide isomerase/thioredoxin
LAASVAFALGFGAWRLVVDGRFRGTHPVRGAPQPDDQTDEHDPRLDVWAEVVRTGLSPAGKGGAGDVLGERATLLQFSSAFCAPCRATRRVLTDVAAVVPGVTHVEVDAEHHLALVRTLGILRTPTTLVLDASGREVRRAAGAPRKEDVLTALAAVVS